MTIERSRLSPPSTAEVIDATRRWIERAVIGLNLCPFAKAVYVRERIRYVVSGAQTDAVLLGELERELRALAEADADIVDTTLLIHPHVLAVFLDYNDFLDEADRAIARLGLTGVLQIASFHPAYQFGGTTPDDVINHTNRSPYPMLHLLREASVEAAVATFPDTGTISERNIDTLRRLGLHGLMEILRG